MSKRVFRYWKSIHCVGRLVLHVMAAFICVFLVIKIAGWNATAITSVSVSYDGETYTAIDLPYKKDYIGDYWVRVEVQSVGIKEKVRLFPDDEIHSLSVNGKTEDLSRFSKSQRQDYSRGFEVKLDLSGMQSNQILMRLSNQSNPSGFDLIFQHSIYWQQGVLLFLVLSFYVAFLSLSLPISSVQMPFAILGIVLCVTYLSVTGERERIFDVYEGGGHKDYIEFLSEKGRLPDPGNGWEYHQPPVYYAIAAVVRTLFVDNPESSDLWGRVLALWFWVVFVQASLATLNKGIVGSKAILMLCSGLFCLWPSGIIHSVRIGNDIPVYMFCGLAFFFIVEWWKSAKCSSIWWASIWIFFAILTKSNGLILAAVLFGLIFSRGAGHAILERRFSTFWCVVWRPAAIAVSLSFLSLALNLGDNIYNYMTGASEDWLLSNVSTTIHSGLKVGNGISNYLIFDFSTFIQSPFISTWEDQYGRQYFWNFVLRSALTSEYFFHSTPLVVWGAVNGVSLLLLLASMFFVLFKTLERFSKELLWRVYKQLPWVLLLVISIVFLLAYRIKVPLSCNTDFRYIYMALISIVYFVAQSARSRGLLGSIGVIVPSVIIQLGTLFWIYNLLGLV